MTPNYYKILGLRPGATASEVKIAYRRLAHKYHPDKGGQKEVMQKLNMAYHVLYDSLNTFAPDLKVRSTKSAHHRRNYDVNLQDFDTADRSSKISIIISAIKSNHSLLIDYVDTGGSETRRIIVPKEIIFINDCYYLGAFCQLRQDLRTFRISRIIILGVR